MAVLEKLEPKEVFYFFEEICKIPRGTFHTKQISEYCVNFAKERGLWYRQDEANNVLIKKPGQGGHEQCEPLILQGHLDMVCEKTADSTHDFEKDGLTLLVEGGFVTAKDTTLGADDGIAVAMMLAALDSQTLPHCPIEALFTTDEEVGMSGVQNIDLSDLEGTLFLNMDSEDEGILTVGCAGGARTRLRMSCQRENMQGQLLQVHIGGLQGGHSGMEIHKQRGNANRLAGRLLYALSAKQRCGLVTLFGGDKDNVITAECDLSFVTQQGEAVKKQIDHMVAVWQAEFGQDEPDVRAEVTLGETGTYAVLTQDCQDKVVDYLINCPNGVIEFNRHLEGLVETSCNLGIVSVEEEKIFLSSLVRSSSASKMIEMKQRFASYAKRMGAEMTVESEYPGWQYCENSRIRPLLMKAYTEVFGKEPLVTTLHAGLECGLLLGKKPDLDPISIGPQMHDVHSYKERLDIASTARTWEVVKRLLTMTGERK